MPYTRRAFILAQDQLHMHYMCVIQLQPSSEIDKWLGASGCNNWASECSIT